MSGSATWPDSAEGGTLGDGRHALATLRPDAVEELCGIVRDRVLMGHAIYPQGGRTALDYGGVPRSPGVAIDMTGISRLIDYPFADMTITVGSRDDPQSPARNLGGKGSARAGRGASARTGDAGGNIRDQHERSAPLCAGRPRDPIIGVSFVTSAGAVVKGGGRVVKNVAGYDFPKLLTGSMGTLGIITQLTLKVRPIPEASAIAWVPFWNPKSLADALDQLNTSGTRPVALDVLNGSGREQSDKGWVCRPVRASSRSAMKTMRALCAGRSTGSRASWVETKISRSSKGRIHSRCGPRSRSSRRRDLVRSASSRIFGRRRSRRSLAPSIRSDGPYKRTQATELCVPTRSASGLLMGLDDRLTSFRALATREGGNLILSRCPTAWKESLRVWGDPRPDWAIAERVKAALDSHAAMNPGRFVGKIWSVVRLVAILAIALRRGQTEEDIGKLHRPPATDN